MPSTKTHAKLIDSRNDNFHSIKPKIFYCKKSSTPKLWNMVRASIKSDQRICIKRLDLFNGSR